MDLWYSTIVYSKHVYVLYNYNLIGLLSKEMQRAYRNAKTQGANCEDIFGVLKITCQGQTL